MTTPNVSPEAMGIASNARWTEPADRLPEMTRPAWMAAAACRGADTNLFFHERWECISEEALAICAGCAVRKPCLDYALDNNETHGTWGGTSGRQRQKMRMRKGAA